MARKTITEQEQHSKTCTKCGEVKIASTDKTESEFYKDRSQKDGFATWCKDCERNYNKAYHAGLKAADASKKIAIADETGLQAFEAEMVNERVTRGWYKQQAKQQTQTRARARTAKAKETGKASATPKTTTRRRSTTKKAAA